MAIIVNKLPPKGRGRNPSGNRTSKWMKYLGGQAWRLTESDFDGLDQHIVVQSIRIIAGRHGLSVTLRSPEPGILYVQAKPRKDSDGIR